MLNNKYYKSDPLKSKGRFYDAKNLDFNRDEYSRDRDRIIHSTAFRRLKGKTQVFINSNIDMVRTRLTHTIEVSQISRTIAKALGTNECLAEAIALAHDLGHPPFGHAGEDLLDELLKKNNNKSGFNHNIQSMRVVTELENSYLNHKGLNLTWECLDGILKHSGVIKKPCAYFKKFANEFGFDLSKNSSIEGQIAAISDDIAYCSHDLDDGLLYANIDFVKLRDETIFDSVYNDFLKENGLLEKEVYQLEKKIVVKELIRKLLKILVKDVVLESINNLKELNPETPIDVINSNKLIVSFSKNMQKEIFKLKRFLLANMYKSESMNKKIENNIQNIEILFYAILNDKTLLPKEWQKRINNNNFERVIADYIAGMSDFFIKLKVKEINCTN